MSWVFFLDDVADAHGCESHGTLYQPNWQGIVAEHFKQVAAEFGASCAEAEEGLLVGVAAFSREGRAK